MITSVLTSLWISNNKLDMHFSLLTVFGGEASPVSSAVSPAG